MCNRLVECNMITYVNYSMRYCVLYIVLYDLISLVQHIQSTLQCINFTSYRTLYTTLHYYSAVSSCTGAQFGGSKGNLLPLLVLLRLGSTRSFRGASAGRDHVDSENNWSIPSHFSSVKNNNYCCHIIPYR